MTKDTTDTDRLIAVLERIDARLADLQRTADAQLLSSRGHSDPATTLVVREAIARLRQVAQDAKERDTEPAR